MTKTNSLRSSASALEAFSVKSSNDPYVYQVGFGNRFASEAIPGTLPRGQNNPQKAKYGLYTEQLNGTAFTMPRNQNQSALMYRIRPTVVHDGFTELPQHPSLEHNFLSSNPKVRPIPGQLAWKPMAMPSEPTDFVEGITTITGAGDSTIREGLAIHFYAANASMERRAFVNVDGDMLIVPAEGKLDVQTEFGKLMVNAGEIIVVQRGIRFKVGLPEGTSRGFIQEIFGSHYELPELGPLGTHCMANPRDFESPVASFEIDHNPWEIIHKIAGTLHVIKQQHTPFDVVAWHGNYVPYKYDLNKFITVGSITKDHPDPSIYCVLTARSKWPGTPLTDFVVLTPRWDVAENTFRPAYYHRNTAGEFIGLIRGQHGATDEVFPPGSANCVTSFSPHGVNPQVYKAATCEKEQRPMRVSQNDLLFAFESSMQFSFTEFALNRVDTKPEQRDPAMWTGLEAEFISRISEVNKDLRTLGLAELQVE